MQGARFELAKALSYKAFARFFAHLNLAPLTGLGDPCELIYLPMRAGGSKANLLYRLCLTPATLGADSKPKVCLTANVSQNIADLILNTYYLVLFIAGTTAHTFSIWSLCIERSIIRAFLSRS